MFNEDEMELYKRELKNKIYQLININQIEEAWEVISKYEEIVKNDIEINHAKSMIYIIEGKYEKAKKILVDSISIDDSNVDTYYNLGYISQITKNYTDAYKFYEIAKNKCTDETLIIEINEILKEISRKDTDFMTSKEKKVLIFAHIFPPIGGSGVQRTLKFVKYLRNYGWEPIVVTAGKTNYPLIDQSLVNEIPEGIRIIRIDEDYKVNSQIVSEICALFECMKINNQLLETYKGNLARDISNIAIPDVYILWANKVLKEISEYIDVSEIDLIYTTSGPYSDHLIGYHLKNQFYKPWVADFRDEWTNNPYANPDKDSWIYKMHFALEEKIVHVADKVINVTPVSTDNYREIFKLNDEKLVTITNGYDEDDFQEIVLSDKKNDKFTIIHNGLLYGIRNPIPILKAIKNLIDQNKIDRNRIKLNLSWSENANEWSSYIVDLQLEDIVEFFGYVSHKESLQIASEADILLLIVGPGEKNKAMYPGKLFEYLRLQKPILSLAPKESVVEKLINELDRGINVYFNDIKAIERALFSMYQGWENGEIQNYELNEDIVSFERKALTKKMATVFNQVYMKNVPKVSIIVPIYNVEKYLVNCLDSLVNQTLNEIEVILVDDGSKDDSIKIAESYVNRYSNFKLYFCNNGGPGGARNTGLDYVTGEYIMFLDSDDMLTSNACQVLYDKALEKNADIVIGKPVWRYQDGSEKPVEYLEHWFKKDLSTNFRNDYRIAIGFPVVHGKLIKSSLIIENEIQFPSKIVGEDVVFSVYSFNKSTRIFLIPETVYLRTERLDPNNKSITQRFNLKTVKDRLYGFRLIREYCLENSLFEIFQDSINMLGYIQLIISKIDDSEEKEKALKLLNEYIIYFLTENEKRYLIRR
ncbi:glycosyltransferase [Caldifermentibacillus hisashii]|uniref:glycosyltransferase n=1 Tax=Caldifermentibacillus hisashii TaxID=996558 RepID=UPI003D1B6755